MFYLKELFLIGRDHKALTLVNLSLLALFFTSIHHGGEIRQFFSLEAKTSAFPYFNALIGSGTGHNHDYITRKMANLPGVAKVELKDSKRLRGELKGFFRDLGDQASLLSKNYQAYKIHLNKGSGKSSHKLIKEYFSRLTGNKDVTFSGVKSPVLLAGDKNKAYTFFSEKAEVYFQVLIAIGWLFTLWLLSGPVKAQTFIIERFQRKENTAIKIYACACAVAVIGAAGSLLGAGFNGQFEVANLTAALALMGFGSLFFIKKEKRLRRFL
ncbi:MAG: hypothetical protein WEB87_02380 [Bacteriovoracaceae bacterium]